MDGHLPELNNGRGGTTSSCTIQLDECFPKEWLNGSSVSATDVFKRLTFEKYRCGDCGECLWLRVLSSGETWDVGPDPVYVYFIL